MGSYINYSLTLAIVVGMVQSSTSFTVTPWVLGHSIQCLPMIIHHTVTHLMSLFEVNYQLLDWYACFKYFWLLIIQGIILSMRLGYAHMKILEN